MPSFSKMNIAAQAPVESRKLVSSCMHESMLSQLRSELMCIICDDEFVSVSDDMTQSS